MSFAHSTNISENKTVIVNLGSLLQLNHKASIDEFNLLAKNQGKAIDWIKVMPEVLALDEEFKEGKCSAEEFRIGIKKILGIDATDDEFDLAWNKMLGNIDELFNKIIQLRDELKSQNVSLVLSTNSNPIHIKKLLDADINSTEKNSSLLGVPLYISYQHKCAHQELYSKIIAEQKLDATRVALVMQKNNNRLPKIKDRDENTEKEVTEWANKTGVHLINFNPAEDKLVLTAVTNALQNWGQKRVLGH